MARPGDAFWIEGEGGAHKPTVYGNTTFLGVLARMTCDLEQAVPLIYSFSLTTFGRRQSVPSRHHLDRLGYAEAGGKIR